MVNPQSHRWNLTDIPSKTAAWCLVLSCTSPLIWWCPIRGPIRSIHPSCLFGLLDVYKTWPIHIYIYSSMYVYMCTYAYNYICLYHVVSVYIRVYMYRCIYIYMYMSTYVYTCLYMSNYIYIYIMSMYRYIYILYMNLDSTTMQASVNGNWVCPV